MKFPNRHRLAQLSRDRNFLVKAGLIIATASVLLGFVVSMTSNGLEKLDPPTEESEFAAFKDKDAFEQVASMVRDPKLFLHPMLEINGFDPEQFFQQFDSDGAIESAEDDLRGEGQETTVEDRAIGFVESAEDRLTEPEFELLNHFARALHSTDDARSKSALEAIQKSAKPQPPLRHANELLGDLAMTIEKDATLALDYYRTEVETFSATAIGQSLNYPAVRVLELLIDTGQAEAARKALGEPEYREALTAFDQLEIASQIPSYPHILRGVLLTELWAFTHWPLWILSGIAALIWSSIIGKFAGFEKSQVKRYVAAFLLGTLSATVTLFFVVVQDDVMGFGDNEVGDVGSQVIYWIAGVGLREELCKLLLFVPMIPFLLRRSDAEVLVCAALVGLGFAFQENIGYYYSGGAGWGRFLTANFLHLSLTGVAGLALVRACRRPKTQWDNALLDFLLVVALHGAYDAVIVMPFFGDYGGIINFILMATIAYLFLHPLRDSLQISRAMAISPLGIFVIGAALLCGITFCYSCWGTSPLLFNLVLGGFVADVAGLLPIAFMYINQFRDL